MTPHETWLADADAALVSLAACGAPFTSDDLLALVGHPDAAHAPNARNNSVGSVFRIASKAGVIYPIGYTKSKVPTRKGGMIRVWRGTSDD